VNIPDLITAAQKDLLQTTITGKAWAKKRGPGKWRDAMEKLEQAKNAAETEPSPAVPAPIAGQGYRLVWEDTFSGPLDRNKWSKVWFQEEPKPDEVFTENGHLVCISHRKYGYAWTEICTMPYDQSSGKWRYGAFEIRFRWFGGRGAWPCIWLFSAANAEHYSGDTPPWTTRASEFDIFEGHGARPDWFPWVLHSNTSSRFGEADRTRGYDWKPVGDTTGAWHTVIGLWTKDWVGVYLDDKIVSPGLVATFPSTDQDMFLILGMEAGDGGHGSGGLDATSPAELRVEFDSVRVWQKP
jgi:hypothetical protein